MRKEFVIKKYLEYQEIIKKRKFKKSSSFTIYYQLSDNPYPRIGLLVGKKNGIAVIRNKIKRQVRTFVDKYIDKIFVTPEKDGTARLQIKIFTGEVTEKYLNKLKVRSGHTFKKMIQKYEEGMK